MKLNNGVYEVDTNNASLIGSTDMMKIHDNYSCEIERRYHFYKSTKTGKYFRVMEYKNYIPAGIFKLKVGESQYSLCNVYESMAEAAQNMRRYGAPVPSDLIETI